jgi:hypothetical protein
MWCVRSLIALIVMTQVSAVTVSRTEITSSNPFLSLPFCVSKFCKCSVQVDSAQLIHGQIGAPVQLVVVLESNDVLEFMNKQQTMDENVC